jgi:hypothetical protein
MAIKGLEAIFAVVTYTFIGLTGTVARVFRPSVFFFKSTPPKALIHGLRPLHIWPRICRENRQYLNFIGVNDPAETVLVESLTPLKLVLKNH